MEQAEERAHDVARGAGEHEQEEEQREDQEEREKGSAEVAE